jgi:predicted nucleic acid-binding protein
MDIPIAGTALANRAILVTHNSQELSWGSNASYQPRNFTRRVTWMSEMNTTPECSL